MLATEIAAQQCSRRVLHDALHVHDIHDIPKQVYKDIYNAIVRFSWGGTDTQRKMHWIAWWKMSIPKHVGGMGF
jgi:hypothetical protein